MKKTMDFQSSTVCCMCGDVGFSDKLFRCSSKCCNRIQHSYCSNYYKECAEPIEICDWCQCEEKKSSSSSKHMGSSSSSRNTTNEARSTYSDDKAKNHDGAAEKAAGKSPSPRPTTRRYKLLKDVMC